MDIVSEIKAFIEHLRKYHIDYSFLFTTGSAITLGIIMAWRLRRDLYNARQSAECPHLSCLIDGIDLRNIAELASCSKIKVKKCAEQILLDRAMRIENLRMILKSCLSTDLKTTRKAVSVIGMLVRCPDFKERLISCGALQALVGCISNLSDNNNYDILVRRCKEVPDCRSVTEDAIFSLSELMSGDQTYLAEQFYCYDRDFISNILLNIMCDSGKNMPYATRTYAILLLNQLAQSSSPGLHIKMVEDKVHYRTADCFLKTLGDKILAQCLLQVIVTIVTENEKQNIDILHEVGRFKLISPLIGCIKSDNPELVYWALELVHEFAQKDMFKQDICKQPGIIKTLTVILKETEACVQAIVLRILSYLALLNEEFQSRLLDYITLIQHLSVCLASGVPNVYHWALVLVHDIAREGRAATEKLLQINIDIVKNVLPHALSDNYITMRTALETLGFFYPCDQFHEKMFVPGSMKVFTDVSAIDDKDIREWAAAFLVRISMSSDEARSTIVTDGCIYPLMQLAARADDANMAWEFTRTLVMVGFLDSTLDIHLKSGVESSVIVNGREYSSGKDGLNIVTFDVSSYKFQGTAFSLKTEHSINECRQFLQGITEWSLVFLSVQGHNELLQAGLQTLKDELETLLPPMTSLNTDTVFSLVSLKSDMFKEYRYFRADNGHVEIDIEFGNLGTLVSVAVLYNLMIPLMDIFMGVPAISTISKVAELESLTILAQQKCLAEAMVTTSGFLEHLNELIWNFTALNQTEMMENPLKLVHCIGAMKIVHLISGIQRYHEDLITRNTLDAMALLLYTLSQVSVSTMEDVVYFWLNESPVPGQVSGMNKRCVSLSHYHSAEEKVPSKRKDPSIGNIRSVSTECREPSKEVEQRQYDILQLDEEAKDATAGNDGIERPSSSLDIESEGASSSHQVQSEANDVKIEAAENYNYKNSDVPVSCADTEDINNEGSDFEEELLPFAFEDDDDDESGRPHTQGETGRQIISRNWRPNTGGSEFCSRPLRSVHSRTNAVSGALSRSLTESSFRVKSPMKNLTTDLESFSEATENLTDYVVSTLYHLLNGGDNDEVRAFIQKSHGFFLLQGLILCGSRSLNQKIGIAMSDVLSKIFCGDKAMKPNRSTNVTLKKEDATPHVTIGSDHLTIRNGSWTFETVCASHFVSKSVDYAVEPAPVGWYYEVLLLSKGIVQIGWISGSRNFSVEKGIGIGDMKDSVAFDGFRCKVLNGSPKECHAIDYGKEWDQNDVIGCLLSCNGDVSFSMNGESLGIAVHGMDTSMRWYPAASLTCSNQCQFAFSRRSQRYTPPSGFVAIEDDVQMRQNSANDTITGSNDLVEQGAKGNIFTEIEHTGEVSALSKVLKGADTKSIESHKRPFSPPIDIARPRRASEKMKIAGKVLFPLSFDYESDATSDIVVTYFEVQCSPDLIDVFEFGYCSCNNPTSRRTFQVHCSSRQIVSCSEDIYDEEQTFDSFSQVGCAVLWPSCRVLLTVDGIPSNSILNPPSDEKANMTASYMPTVSSPDLVVNFGDKDFMFKHCDKPENRLKMAKFHLKTVLEEEQDIS